MKSWLPARYSLRTEVLMLVCAASLSAILLVVALILVRGFFGKRHSKAQQFRSVAVVLADNLTVAVAFQENEVAASLLNSLTSEASVTSAVVVDQDRKVFASYGASEELEQDIADGNYPGSEHPELPHRRFAGDLLTVTVPIQEFDEPLGQLLITADTSDIWAELKVFARDTCLACVVVLAVTVLISRQLQSLITEPILALAETARDVSEQDDYSLRVTHPARGEVAQLRDQFNLMLSRLESSSQQIAATQKELLETNQQLENRVAERTQELAGEVRKTREAYAELQNLQGQLAETARAAGMAEIANGVLHNIGNVLNSVNVSAQLSMEKIRGLPIDKLDRVAGLLHQKREELGDEWTSFEGMAALPDLLQQMSNALNNQREGVTRELRHLEEHIEFVKQILQSQQSFSRKGGFLEDVTAEAVFETALKFVSCHNKRSVVQVDRDFQFTGSLRTDKGKLLQILSNYIKNGFEAVSDVRDACPTLVLSTRQRPDGLVEFSVTDNGQGIDPAALDSVFRHGFTTKAEGHGFGLHSAACAARELHGNVAVHSEGPGLGARFCVRVPVCPQPAVSPVADYPDDA